MLTILMMSGKMGTLGLLKIKVSHARHFQECLTPEII